MIYETNYTLDIKKRTNEFDLLEITIQVSKPVPDGGVVLGPEGAEIIMDPSDPHPFCGLTPKQISMNEGVLDGQLQVVAQENPAIHGILKVLAFSPQELSEAAAPTFWGTYRAKLIAALVQLQE